MISTSEPVADPFSSLQKVRDRLHEAGFDAELITPDADDPLGGTITIKGGDIDPIQIVNFFNPLAPGRSALGRAAIESATKSTESSFFFVDIPHLTLLKLFAGGFKDKADALELLRANPGFNAKQLRRLAKEFGLTAELEEILAEL